jgi:hypothetical protein
MIRCVHRGPILRQETQTRPGCRARDPNPVPVYRCLLHGACSYRPYKAGQLERVCLRCNDQKDFG